MTVKAYVKAGGKVREIKGLFAKKNGKVVRVKEIYVGRDGAKQLVFKTSTELFPKLEIITAQDLTYEGIKLPKGTYGEEYNAKIQAIGGTGVYRFDFVELNGKILESRVWLKGLTLYPDGSISGVPKTGGAISRLVRVTDSSGEWWNKRIRVRIGQKDVYFHIYDDRPVYDGLPKKLRVVPSLSEITEDDYTVTIAGAEFQTEVGTYEIVIKMVGEKAQYYRVSGKTVGVMAINRNPGSKISLSSQTVKYDGQPHALIPIVEPIEIQNDYKVTYKGKNGTVYEESEQPPTAVGSYTVKAETTNKNYTVRTATATLTITE